MPLNHRTLTREELYELVWSTPMAKLSKEFGLSDVGLAKTCKRFEIPRPPRGYWAKLEAGQKPRRLMLPEPLGKLPATITITAKPTVPDSALNSNGNEGSKLPSPIVVPEHLTSPHPLIERARVQLRVTHADSSGLVSTDSATAPNIAVAKSSITRALLLFDTLMKAWEENGGAVQLGMSSFDRTNATFFSKNDERVSVRLYEQTEFVNDPKLLRNTTEYFHRPRRPTGRLAFETVRNYCVSLRSIWRDGSKQRLENELASLIHGIEAHLKQNRLQSLDRACKARQEHKVKQLAEEAQQRKDLEKERRELLLSEMKDWELCTRIRNYLSHLRSQMEAGAAVPEDKDNCEKWFAWANWFADHLDPLIRAKPKVTPDAAPQNQSLAEMDLTSETRSVLEAVGIQDAEGLLQVKRETVAPYCQYNDTVMTEISRVLAGLGYKRIQ